MHLYYITIGLGIGSNFDGGIMKKQPTPQEIIVQHEAQRTVILANMMRRQLDDEEDRKMLISIDSVIKTAEMLTPPVEPTKSDTENDESRPG